MKLSMRETLSGVWSVRWLLSRSIPPARYARDVRRRAPASAAAHPQPQRRRTRRMAIGVQYVLRVCVCGPRRIRREAEPEGGSKRTCKVAMRPMGLSHYKRKDGQDVLTVRVLLSY